MNNSLKPWPCFGDLFELDHVCDLLREDSKCIEEGMNIDLFINSPLLCLIDRINKQQAWHRSISEDRYPGGFDKSYLVQEYDNAKWEAFSIVSNPYTLPDKLCLFIISLHRIMILGNLSEDQLEIEVLKNKEINNQLSLMASENKAMKPDAERGRKVSDNARQSLTHREDQIAKRELIAWAKPLIENGTEANNLREVEALPGFDPMLSTYQNIVIPHVCKRLINVVFW